MAKKFKGTNGNDKIVQGNEPGVKIFALGGNDKITLNRTDDLGGGNFVDAGGGNDEVANGKEGGNVIKLGAGNDVYAGSGFASFASERGDTVSGGAGKDQFFFETSSLSTRVRPATTSSSASAGRTASTAAPARIQSPTSSATRTARSAIPASSSTCSVAE